MKTIAIVLVNSILALCVTQISAQTKTSSTSKTTVSVHSDDDVANNSSSYSVTTSDQDGKNTNISISISNSDDNYSLRAKFPKEKYAEIKEVLLKEMSDKNLRTSNGKYVWSSNSNDDEVYSVILNDTRLSMSLDKEIASSSLLEKFENLGTTLRTVITGSDNNMKREAERLQRDAERLKRDAERMQREADRMQREADRAAKEIATRYKKDAKQIAEEAHRLADQASHLSTEAGHKGSISSEIRTLLSQGMTYYNEGTTDGNNWTWPSAQRSLITSLKKDGLIQTENDISFTKDDTGLYSNGTKLSSSQTSKYKSILSKYDIHTDFSFYKSQDHIVLVDSNADIEGFLNALKNKDFITSINKKMKLEINGANAHKDGAQVSSGELAAINELLLKNNIIPAPGKIFEIMKAGAFKVGYSLGDNAHLGTWVIGD